MGVNKRAHSSHISKATVHVFDTLIFLDVLAEWAMALLDVGKLILVLQEEVAAVLAHCDRYVWDHVFEVSAWQFRAVFGEVLDVDLLISHVHHHSLVDLYRLGAVWVDLSLELLKHFLVE